MIVEKKGKLLVTEEARAHGQLDVIKRRIIGKRGGRHRPHRDDFFCVSGLVQHSNILHADSSAIEERKEDNEQHEV